MPRKAKEIKKEERVVYALVSSLSDKRIYVGQCISGNEKQVYRLHLQGVYASTQRMFNDGKSLRILPKMHVLERITGTKNDAKIIEFAYLKFFELSGYFPQMSENGLEWLADISESSRQFFDKIRAKNVADILTKDNLIIENYRRAEWDKNSKTIPENSSNSQNSVSKNARITVWTTIENETKIKNNAAKIGLTKSEYCERMILHGQVVTVDNREIYRAIRDVQRDLQLLKNEMTASESNDAVIKELFEFEKRLQGISNLVREESAKIRNEGKANIQKTIKKATRNSKKQTGRGAEK